MPLRLSKKTSPLAAKPEAMSSELTLVDSSRTLSDKKAPAGNAHGFDTYSTQRAE
jgi:hypothetical protein